jgi:hypothetical protein
MPTCGRRAFSASLAFARAAARPAFTGSDDSTTVYPRVFGHSVSAWRAAAGGGAACDRVARGRGLGRAGSDAFGGGARGSREVATITASCATGLFVRRSSWIAATAPPAASANASSEPQTQSPGYHPSRRLHPLPRA